MADVIHRTTLEFRRSVNEPDFPEPTWKHSPDMSAVAGIAPQYWKAPPDWDAANAGPLEMSQAEKDVVDAAALNASRDSTAAELDELEGALRAFALTVLDEINTLRSEHALAPRTIAQLKTAMRNKLGT